MLNITLSFPALFGTEVTILLNYYDWTDFNDKKIRLGTCYRVLCLNPQTGIDMLSVNVKDKAPVISREALYRHNAEMSFVLVRFEDFTARPYKNKVGKDAISARAAAIEVVSDINGEKV